MDPTYSIRVRLDDNLHQRTRHLHTLDTYTSVATDSTSRVSLKGKSEEAGSSIYIFEGVVVFVVVLLWWCWTGIDEGGTSDDLVIMIKQLGVVIGGDDGGRMRDTDEYGVVQVGGF